MSERDDLKAEALALEVTFKGNISNVKLKKLIAEAKGEPEPLEETAPAGPAVKKQPKEEAEAEISPAQSAATAVYIARRKKVQAAKARAFKTTIVVITNKDPRENDVMTTAYLSFENQHFGLSKLVPLDQPVELEHALIAIAASTTMTLHKAEVLNGRHTGNKVSVTVKKFAVSYPHQQKS